MKEKGDIMENGERMVKEYADYEQLSKERKAKVVKSGWVVALAMIVIFVCTLIPIIMMGWTTMTIYTPVFMILVFVYPIAFFFFGVYLVLKVKFIPETKDKK